MLWARVSVMGPTDPVTAGPGGPGGPGKTGRPYPTKNTKEDMLIFEHLNLAHSTCHLPMHANGPQFVL